MSTALQFTSIFDPANPPQKLNIGGMGMSPKPGSLPIAARKALDARGIKKAERALKKRYNFMTGARI